MRPPGDLGRLTARLHARWTRFVFIVAPMRSGTTLLQHILADAPGMLTAGETHLVYRSPRDLDRLVQKVYRYTRHLSLRPRTVIEKCVSDELIADPAVLTDPRVRTIFMLRDGAATVGSLLALRDMQWPHADDPEDATRYFLARTARLRSLAQRIDDPARALFVTYEELTTASRRTLDAIATFLDLATPLSERYRTRRWTGVPARGDLSRTLRLGTIVRPPALAPAALDGERRARLAAAHRSTVRVLARCCRTVSPHLP